MTLIGKENPWVELCKPFRILVGVQGQGGEQRSGDPVIGASGDRKGKTSQLYANLG